MTKTTATKYAPQRTLRRAYSALATPHLDLIKKVNPRLTLGQINNGIFCRLTGYYIGHNNLFNNQPLFTLHPLVTQSVSSITSLLPKAIKSQEQHLLLIAMLYQLNLIESLEPLHIEQATIAANFPKLAIVWLRYTDRGHILDLAARLPQYSAVEGNKLSDFIDSLCEMSMARKSLTEEHIDKLLGFNDNTIQDKVQLLQAKFAGKIRATGYNPSFSVTICKDLNLDDLTTNLVNKALNGDGISIESLVKAYNILNTSTETSTILANYIKAARNHLTAKINKAVIEQNGLGLFDTLRFNPTTGNLTSTPITFAMLSEGIAQAAQEFKQSKANGTVNGKGDIFEATSFNAIKPLDLGLSKPKPTVSTRKRFTL